VRTLTISLGIVMVVVGGLWTFQGLGYVKGSSMTGNSTWAVVGPIVAGLGVALAYVGITRSRH
jgi:hypothetical protein